MADDTRVTHSRSGFACAARALLRAGLPCCPRRPRPRDIIVRRDPGLSAAERADVRADAGVELERCSPLPRHRARDRARRRARRRRSRALNADPTSAYAAPNVRYVARRAATDTYFADQLGARELGQHDARRRRGRDGRRHGRARGAGSVTVAASDQTVAVVDTGPRTATHPDLAGQTSSPGARCVPARRRPADGNDHGTHVAGLIARSRQRRSGIAGVAPRRHVLPLRALDNCGDGSSPTSPRRSTTPATTAIPIVDRSFDQRGLGPTASSSRDADRGATRDTLFVVAAGNEGIDADVDNDAGQPCAT